MTLEERNQKVRAFFNGKIDTYDDVHSEYMKTKVLLAESLDMGAKKIRLLKKILDCLKNGGKFINCDLIALSPEEEAEQLVELENNTDDTKHIDIPLTLENEIDALEKSGFTQITSSNGSKENYGLFVARKEGV